MEMNRSAFALKLIVGFPLVGFFWTFIIFFLSNSETFNFNIAYFIGGIGVSLGLLCLSSKGIFQFAWRCWQKLILIIDTTITWLTLPIFYYLIFSPFALLLRLLGKANMKHPNKNLSSYWKDAERPNSLKQYLRQF